MKSPCVAPLETSLQRGRRPLPMATDVQLNKLSPLDPRGVSGNQTWLAGKSSINGDCPASH